MADTPGSVEREKDFGTGPTASVGKWLAEIRAYDTTFKDWEDAATRALKRYRNEGDASANPFGSTTPRRFNIFWSNVQTLQPALYSRTPKADITRTHKDKNPAARASAVILERATHSELKYSGFDDAMRAARDDYLIAARGQVWVRYVPTYGDETKDRIFLQADTSDDGAGGYSLPDGSPPPDGDEPLFDDGGLPYIEDGEPYRPVVSECVKVEHINWKDFGHTPAPNWKKVRAVWKLELMTRDQLAERFGEDKATATGMNRAVPNVNKDAIEQYGDTFKRAEVYEIWDKTSRKVIWISPGYTQGPLDEIDDPLKLEGFFPCPKPIYGTLTTDSLVPVTDYDEYRAQAEEIDLLTERIRLLTKALKVAGAYDSQLGTVLERIFSSEDNTMVPVDNWAMFGDKGGLAGVLSFLPIKDIAGAIVSLTQIREQAKRDLFEVSGLSDLMRGQGQASATATAESIKGQYAGMRMEDRQALMARFARDTVQIVAEIIAEHFSPETLRDISGWDYTVEARTLDRQVEQWTEKMQKAMQAMQQQAAPQGMPGQQPPPMNGAQPPGQLPPLPALPEMANAAA